MQNATVNPSLIDIVFHGEWIQIDPQEVPTPSKELLRTLTEKKFELVAHQLESVPYKVRAYNEAVSVSFGEKILWTLVAGAVVTAVAALFALEAPLAFVFFAGVSLAAIWQFSYKAQERCNLGISEELDSTIDFINTYGDNIERILLDKESDVVLDQATEKKPIFNSLDYLHCLHI